MTFTGSLGRGMRAWLELLGTRCPPDRIEKAQAYVAVGSVLELAVEAGVLRGQVQGDVARPHDVEVQIRPLDDEAMGQLREAVHERMGSTDALLQLLCPASADLRSRCTCADWSPLCEHGATLFLSFLDVHPARRAELLTFRGYAADSDEVAVALETLAQTTSAVRTVFARPAAPVRRPRRPARPRDEETLPLPFEEAERRREDAATPSRAREPKRARTEPAAARETSPASGATSPASRETSAASREMSPASRETSPAVHPLAGFWRAAELPPIPPLATEAPSSMLACLGPPPWCDAESAQAVLGPLWEEIAGYARTLVGG